MFFGRLLVLGAHGDTMALYQIMGMYQRLMFVLFVSWLFGVGKVLSDNEKCYFLRIHRQGSSYPMAQDSHASDSVIRCSLVLEC
jgi:hypothetical protein